MYFSNSHFLSAIFSCLMARRGAEGGTPVWTQTPAATVKSGSNALVLQSSAEGQLLASDSFGSGALPASSSGTRLTSRPAKATVRAGKGDRQQRGRRKEALLHAPDGCGLPPSLSVDHGIFINRVSGSPVYSRMTQ